MPAGIGATFRFKAIQDLNLRSVRKFEPLRDDRGKTLRVSEYFGVNTFDFRQMRQKLPKEVYAKLVSTIETGKPLDPEIATPVAHAVKEWALSRDVTHFCHWFQPQTGSTAEKHDAFIHLDNQGKVIEKFSGAMLIQSEPDASSFPSGGMRTTFEARGYTAWDPSSPIFIMEHRNGKTLCIPSVFISYHGDALDEKTGLLRSMEVLSTKACALLGMMGHPQIQRVVPTLGIEQEYFLIDRAFFQLRPDLVMSGRTLVGGQPPRGQQLEDHYFGSIPSRVQAFMSEVEHELYKLGVPIKTRHNEVAPSQFEAAPIFEEANVATDHNQLTMEVLKKVALRHQLSVLFHEKPFAGMNGSGKHNNWSMMIAASGPDYDGENLLEPGQTPSQNLRFLMLLVGILKGVQLHAGLLRAGIASSGNDHRLGANEAPPAIISVFLGDQLNRILNQIQDGLGDVVAEIAQGSSDPLSAENVDKTGGRGELAAHSNQDVQAKIEAAVIRLGVAQLPEIMRDHTDRNRTSPFAFTGNKFEFRAVGSSSSTAFPITLLNAAVADGYAYLTQLLEKKLLIAANRELAILDVLRTVVKETQLIRFEGNNYSPEWIVEAERRGLPHLRKTPESLQELVRPAAKELLTRLKIFSEAELVSRCHVRLERYVKNVTIELDTFRMVLNTQILPAVHAYYGDLAQTVVAAKGAGVLAPQSETLQRLASLMVALQSKRNALESITQKLESTLRDEDKAVLLSDEIARVMGEARHVCDELETVVADDYWPLPKYREMLFLT